MQYFFENHEVDTDRRELKRGGEPIALAPQVFDLLIYLLQSRDRIVSKDDLVTNVWAGRIVSDSAIDSRINAVRKAVGDSGEQQKFIRTFARKGIRFVGDVVERDADDAESLRGAAIIDGRPTFAVLPFQNLSDDPSQEYFADGLSEDLITSIGGWCRLPVISRHSSFIYKGRSINVMQVGRELGARYVLEGSVRRSGDRLRITAQFTDAATGHQVWAERYDCEIGDIFVVQDEITAKITAAVEPELHEREQRRAATSTKTRLAAYDLVQRGNWHHNKYTADDAKDAQRLFLAAIEADPDYGPAYASMAYTKYWMAQMRWSDDPKTTLESALEFAQKAVECDEKDARAHLYVGQVSLWLHQHNIAISEAQRAIELNPSLVQAYSVLGYALDCIGEFEEAIRAVTHSLRLRPHDKTLARCIPALSIAHYQLHAYDKAEEIAQRAVRINTIYWIGHQLLAASLGQLGRIREATLEISEIRQREPQISRSEYSSRLPFRDPTHARHIEDGLLKAGWLD